MTMENNGQNTPPKTRSKAEPLICPGCLKPQRNITRHIKAGCPGRPELPGVATTSTNTISLPPEFIEAIQQLGQSIQEAQIMAKTAADKTDAAVKVLPDIVSRQLTESLPALVDQMLTARLDQLVAQFQTNQPAQPGGPPAQGSGGGLVSQVAPLLLQKLMAGDSGSSNNSFEGLLKTMAFTQQLTSMMNQPMYEGMKMMSMVLSTALKTGASPEKPSRL